jgi:hypothetical protein
VALANTHRRSGRALAVAAVLLLHAAAVLAPLVMHRRASQTFGNEPTLIWLDLPAPVAAPSQADIRAPAPTASPQIVVRPPDSVAIQTPEPESRIDWRAAAEIAANGITSLDGTEPKSFGAPPRAPVEPRDRKPFGWDRSRTNRVESMPSGGLVINLNDHCALVIAPILFGGCSLGKIEARGDLFDEMKAPPQLGDWKDSSVPGLSPNR